MSTTNEKSLKTNLGLTFMGKDIARVSLPCLETSLNSFYCWGETFFQGRQLWYTWFSSQIIQYDMRHWCGSTWFWVGWSCRTNPSQWKRSYMSEAQLTIDYGKRRMHRNDIQTVAETHRRSMPSSRQVVGAMKCLGKYALPRDLICIINMPLSSAESLLMEAIARTIRIM